MYVSEKVLMSSLLSLTSSSSSSSHSFTCKTNRNKFTHIDRQLSLYPKINFDSITNKPYVSHIGCSEFYFRPCIDNLSSISAIGDLSGQWKDKYSKLKQRKGKMGELIESIFAVISISIRK